MNKLQLIVPVLFVVAGLGLIFVADPTTRDGISKATSGGFLASLGAAWLYLLFKGSKREQRQQEGGKDEPIQFKSDWME